MHGHRPDPIEKKPLYRFHPGSAILSLGSWGCNFTCPFCQNWQISQQEAPFRELTPEQALALARHYRADGSIGLAYTYNEPTLSYESIIQTARLVHEAGLVNVMVSNGYIEKEPLQALLPYIDAWNIDLKGFSQDFYQSLCGASLQPVLDTIEAAAAVSHVEVTTLVIPGENDDPAQMDAEARWLASISPDIPLHLTRYFAVPQLVCADDTHSSAETAAGSSQLLSPLHLSRQCLADAIPCTLNDYRKV